MGLEFGALRGSGFKEFKVIGQFLGGEGIQKFMALAVEAIGTVARGSGLRAYMFSSIVWSLQCMDCTL